MGSAGTARGGTKRLELEITEGAKGIDELILDLMSQQLDNQEKIDQNTLSFGGVEEALRARIEALEEVCKKVREENDRLREGLGREVRRETYLEDQKRLFCMDS